MASSPITSWQIEGEKVETVTNFLSLGCKITVDDNCSHEIRRCLFLGRKAMTNPDSILKSRRITLLTAAHIVKAMVFPSSHIPMWELNYKEGWARKNSCFWTLVLEKTLESPLDCREVKLVNPKGNQPWIFTGRTHAEAPILWATWCEEQLIGKDPGAGKDWGQKEKGVAEDEIVR